MNRNIILFISIFLIEYILTIPISASREAIYLPMKKDHIYGDDICYYRENDEKLYYAIYYVKPCEQGKYCEDQASYNQKLGFCRDIPTNYTEFPSYGDSCNTDAECPGSSVCDDGKCKKKCSSPTPVAVKYNYNNFICLSDNYLKAKSEYRRSFVYHFSQTDPKQYLGTRDTYYGEYPGLPKEYGIEHYTGYTDVDPNNSGSTTYKTFTRYLLTAEEWTTIGGAKDGDFVTNWRFCKSGFTLNFYPDGKLEDPSYLTVPIPYDETLKMMCVTPIKIDMNNPMVDGCVVTYKINEESEKKYKASAYRKDCNPNDVIQSQLYSEFIDEFNNANEDDQKNCYKLPQDFDDPGNCQNRNLLKLAYFYKNINDYLFYKDREDLEKVLHFKIQQKYYRYASSSYLNLKYLFFLLFLILL